MILYSVGSIHGVSIPVVVNKFIILDEVLGFHLYSLQLCKLKFNKEDNS